MKHEKTHQEHNGNTMIPNKSKVEGAGRLYLSKSRPQNQALRLHVSKKRPLLFQKVSTHHAGGTSASPIFPKNVHWFPKNVQWPQVQKIGLNSKNCSGDNAPSVHLCAV
jgi:hypothetical protein